MCLLIKWQGRSDRDIVSPPTHTSLQACMSDNKKVWTLLWGSVWVIKSLLFIHFSKYNFLLKEAYMKYAWSPSEKVGRGRERKKKTQRSCVLEKNRQHNLQILSVTLEMKNGKEVVNESSKWWSYFFCRRLPFHVLSWIRHPHIPPFH